MDDGMPYDPIQGQAQSQLYLLRHLQWELARDQVFLN